jgi:amino acid adenylation domain-containing protein
VSETLNSLLKESFERFQDRTALEEPSGNKAKYGELKLLAERISKKLVENGITSGDRVGICSPKSIEAVASIFGTLQAGAAYVPVNPSAPPDRNADILEDCAVGAVIVKKDLLDGFLSICQSGLYSEPITVGEMAIVFRKTNDKTARKPEITREPEKLPAYILYTSGSTGKPKGVVHTNAGALSFVDWCGRTFNPKKEDRFASHAPFYFDLSILDLYLPIEHGATLVLIDEELGKNPMQLAEFISKKKITNWYSTPSILRMMARYGHMERHDYSDLKTVLFAGEVFPIKYLRALSAVWPHHPKYNLYGPTETNVCTFYKIPDKIPEDRSEPFPIGKTCDNDVTKVVDKNGKEVRKGESGELCVAGGTVMKGYWGMPAENSACFFCDENDVKWYKTGDMVRELEDGDYVFLGRQDRMVKRRGFRIELGEIEPAMLTNKKKPPAAVVALPDDENGVTIDAFLCTPTDEKPSLIETKLFCSRALPSYMIPDRFHYLVSLPKTPTEKIDYLALKEMI